MRTARFPLGLVTILLQLVLSLAVTAYAQEPDEGNRVEDVEAQEGFGVQGLADPPPPGFSVLYMFTGVANDTTTVDTIATSVHCTNFGSSTSQVEVQFFSSNGGVDYTATLSFDPSQTRTFSTQPTVIYAEDRNLNAGLLDQGSGRVLANRSHLICTAQVLDPTHAQPVFMAKLPLFDGKGGPVGSVCKTYLPLILRNAAS